MMLTLDIFPKETHEINGQNKNARYQITVVFSCKVVVCKTGWLGEGWYYISIVNTGNVKMSMQTLNS